MSLIKYFLMKRYKECIKSNITTPKDLNNFKYYKKADSKTLGR